MASAEENAKQHYTGIEGRKYHDLKRSIPDEAVPWLAEKRAVKIKDHVRPTDRVFEYGVGFGWNLAALTCAGKSGFDLSDFLADRVAALGIEFIRNPAELPEGSMDVVICHHTLEHVPSPLETLREMRRILRPNGVCLLFVPFEKERRYRHYRSDEPNHHLYSWNAQTLGNLVAESGFVIQSVSVAHFGQERFAAVNAVRFRLGRAGFHLLQRAANFLKNEYEVRLVATKGSQREQ